MLNDAITDRTLSRLIICLAGWVFASAGYWVLMAASLGATMERRNAVCTEGVSERRADWSFMLVPLTQQCLGADPTTRSGVLPWILTTVLFASCGVVLTVCVFAVVVSVRSRGPGWMRRIATGFWIGVLLSVTTFALVSSGGDRSAGLSPGAVFGASVAGLVVIIGAGVVAGVIAVRSRRLTGPAA